MKQVAIIGGGLAGLTNAIALAKNGLTVTVIEKKSYPHHKVCGEYVSNEVLPYLAKLGIDPFELNPARISQFLLGAPSGKNMQMPLDMGGFGISRYSFDHFLYTKAKEAGVTFILEKQVNDISFMDDTFYLQLSDGSVEQADIAIGSFGKRSKLDRQLNRPFFKMRSPYIGVKYHIKADFPKDMVALYNFKDGYCGINSIEDGKLCLCYLTTRDNLKQYGTIPEMEKAVLWQNPELKRIFQQAEYLYDKPEVINEISFERKEAVKDHILMSGDAAGMIAPLCGNGMAMAIHSAKICSQEVMNYQHHRKRELLESRYTERWEDKFAKRLWTGRQIQQLFGRPVLSEIATAVCRSSRPLSHWIIKQTHGKEF